MVELFGLIGSPPPNQDLDRIRELIIASIERDTDRGGRLRQLGAILSSGNRTRELAKIQAPTLVIHGDKDKLILPSGGRATLKAIPMARGLVIKGMGHDMAPAFRAQLIEAIASHAHGADAARSAAAIPAAS
jgi:pimeloyl-ACP methyl ester carboxylesterase